MKKIPILFHLLYLVINGIRLCDIGIESFMPYSTNHNTIKGYKRDLVNAHDALRGTMKVIYAHYINKASSDKVQIEIKGDGSARIKYAQGYNKRYEEEYDNDGE